MPYWTLFERDGGRWGAQFGSDEKADVEAERRDMIDGHLRIRAADLKIVRTPRPPTRGEALQMARQLDLDSPRKALRRNPSRRGSVTGQPYIVKEGRKIYFATVEAAARAAQRLANALGRSVPVSRDRAKKKARRRS